MIIQYLNNIFMADCKSAVERKVIATGEKKSGSIEIIKPAIYDGKYEKDINNLERHIGKDRFRPGLSISVSLAEMTAIVPRKRKRSDAYAGLKDYLQNELGIMLNIRTNKMKTKEGGNENGSDRIYLQENIKG